MVRAVHNSRKIVIGRLKLPMELWCGSDGAAFTSKLAVCPITPTPTLTGLKPAYDENCQGIKLLIAHKINCAKAHKILCSSTEHKQHSRLSRRYRFLGESYGVQR